MMIINDFAVGNGTIVIMSDSTKVPIKSTL